MTIWTPAMITSPARAGMATSSTRLANSNTTTATDRPAKMFAQRERASCADDQRRPRAGAAGRDAAEEAGCQVGGSLPEEIPGDIRKFPIRVGEGLADSRPLHQANDANGDRRNDQLRG